MQRNYPIFLSITYVLILYTIKYSSFLIWFVEVYHTIKTRITKVPFINYVIIVKSINN